MILEFSLSCFLDRDSRRYHLLERAVAVFRKYHAVSIRTPSSVFLYASKTDTKIYVFCSLSTNHRQESSLVRAKTMPSKRE
jgi:hypothetical protein